MSDKVNETLARLVLKTLGDMSLREMAEKAPVSRTTLNRWQQGNYDMWAKTRRKLRAWLRARGVHPIPGPSDDEIADAIRGPHVDPKTGTDDDPQ